MNVTRIDVLYSCAGVVEQEMGTSNGCMAILCTKNCILFKQLSPHLRVYSTYTLSLLLHTLTIILSTYQHHAYTHRWSCNTQAVSNFAKDWIEPIVDKFKLPVGIGELIVASFPGSPPS